VSARYGPVETLQTKHDVAEFDCGSEAGDADAGTSTSASLASSRVPSTTSSSSSC
jgi:hypothetical protein